MKLIIKREIVNVNNNLILILTSKDSSKENLIEKFKLTKENFSKIFGENKNKYSTLCYYI